MRSTVDIGGIKHALTSDDDYLLHVGKVFEPEMVRLFRAVAHGVVLDVGANIGCTALLFSDLADTVHAFEPSRITSAILSTNVASAPNIDVHAFGLGETAGAFELTYASNNRSGGFVSNLTQASTGHSVEMIELRRMDDVVRELGLSAVDFIKLDVEGFEGSVLRGAPETLWRFRPVVVLEMNHWCLNVLQRTSLPDFIDYLADVFPILYAVQEGTYLDLHDPSERYVVMYRHILQSQYATLLGAFDASQVADFHASYTHGLP